LSVVVRFGNLPAGPVLDLLREKGEFLRKFVVPEPVEPGVADPDQKTKNCNREIREPREK